MCLPFSYTMGAAEKRRSKGRERPGTFSKNGIPGFQNGVYDEEIVILMNFPIR